MTMCGLLSRYENDVTLFCIREKRFIIDLIMTMQQCLQNLKIYSDATSL